MTRDQRIRALRAAGKVQRCHTWPYLGSYDNAQHSYEVAMLLYALHPNPSPNLIKAALVHDSVELWTGDLPGPIKHNCKKLEELFKALEARVALKVGINVPITNEEYDWLKAADIAELWLWTIDQISLGNINVTPIKDRIEEYFRLSEWIPQIMKDFVTHYVYEPRDFIYDLLQNASTDL